MKTVSVIAALIIAALLFLRLTSPQSAPLQPETVSGWVRYIVDGDSLYIGKHKPQIRLWGVDAPERGQDGFELASDKLSEIAHGQFVTCRKVATDKYGRTVARCFLKDGREVNRMMIESGAAREFTRYSKGFYSN